MQHALRTVRYFQWNSGLVRRALSLLFRENQWYRIPFGPLRGIKIHYDREVNYHAMLGLWELENFSFLNRVLFKSEEKPGVVVDLGANLGLYSIWFRKSMGDHGVVHAFEPAPYALEKLKKHVEANGERNIRMVPMACADKEGTVTFFIGFHHHSSSLFEGWAGGGQTTPEKVEVASTTLDDYFFGNKLPLPNLIKMDIEGGGVYALKGCRRLAKEQRPFFFIESHTVAEDKAIGDFCLETGYAAYRLSDRNWVKDLRATHPQKDGVWGILFLVPSEKKSVMEKQIEKKWKSS